MIFGMKMVDIYHALMKEYIHTGDIVVDATAGNGHDTEFLCGLVGDQGCVYAFDIQEKAIDNTKQRLKKAGVEHRARLCLASHENLDEYVFDEIAGFCFNLGYLPDGDQTIITKASTTTVAVQKCLDALKTGGIGCVLAYYGHEGGRKEMENVDELLQSLPSRKYEVFRLENHNRAHQPPVLYLIKKLR